MIFLSFIAGLLTSKWLERQLLRAALKVSKGTRYEAQVKRLAEPEIPQKGKILNLDQMAFAKRLEKGGTLEEILDGEL